MFNGENQQNKKGTFAFIFVTKEKALSHGYRPLA
jgi:hypothetical protein